MWTSDYGSWFSSVIQSIGNKRTQLRPRRFKTRRPAIIWFLARVYQRRTSSLILHRNRQRAEKNMKNLLKSINEKEEKIYEKNFNALYFYFRGVFFVLALAAARRERKKNPRNTHTRCELIKFHAPKYMRKKKKSIKRADSQCQFNLDPKKAMRRRRKKIIILIALSWIRFREKAHDKWEKFGGSIWRRWRRLNGNILDGSMATIIPRLFSTAVGFKLGFLFSSSIRKWTFDSRDCKAGLKSA